ncbi:MAG TPA: Stp1/IreP family PP2C-type Ser/Thr phosphatase [Acidimicrobiales bacterium]|nr:Stp1/IreP family PP2C-type Ser/Thr phosphatase [Acidimicrobiales bacterium]
MTVLRSGSATDVGRRRRINQDLPLEATNLFAVADGMGGHVAGEVAARVAVDALLDGFSRDPTAAGLQGAFTQANRAVWQQSMDNSDLRGMGTTLTAMALVGGADGRDLLALANVGDSRAYVFSEGHIRQITADHSLAEERMRHGEITEAEAAVHPQRHILTRVLGASPEVDTDMWELQLRAGDRVVLCSDGLSNEVGLDELGEVLATVPDPDEAAQKLVELANDHGGNDNITAVVIDVLIGEEGDPPASVITPIGARAGAPLVIADGGTTAAGAAGAGAAAAAGPRTDTLAPGARLAFNGDDLTLSVDAVGSGDFFLGNTQAVPVARSTLRQAPSRPVVDAAPPGESRGARRRRLGIPRRITVRVVLFVLLVAAIPTAAYFAIRWYAYDNWFLSVQGKQIVIQQGHRGGVLWFDPKVVDHTGVTTDQVLPTGVAQIHSGVQEPTLADAKHYVANLHNEYVFLHDAAGKKSGATGTGPNGSIPNITAPPSTTSSTTTTTVPGAPPVTATTAVPTTVATTTTTAPVATTTTVP